MTANNRGGAATASLTLADAPVGATVRVACLNCPQAARCARLSAFGLVQGQRITLLQRSPAYVVRLDETELALDEEIAACIEIELA